MNVAPRERVEPGHAVQQSGLAGARWAHDRAELPKLKLNGDAVERADLCLALTINLVGVYTLCGSRDGCRGSHSPGLSVVVFSIAIGPGVPSACTGHSLPLRP